VIKRGPEPYDKTMIALNQVVKYKGYYYAYYHATCPENGTDRWSMNVAGSKDLIHWEKYPGNPIIPPDNSSGILVDDGKGFRLYCMHRAVSLYLPRDKSKNP
jgi:sucrose-6-phosphate hydrolase SacC (GH32 family)